MPHVRLTVCHDHPSQARRLAALIMALLFSAAGMAPLRAAHAAAPLQVAHSATPLVINGGFESGQSP